MGDSGGRADYVERLIKMAAEKATQDAREGWYRLRGRNRYASSNRDAFEAAFRHCVAGALVRRANRAGGPSIRQSAPDSGGRAFHFGHRSVSRLTSGLAPGESVKSTRKSGKFDARDKRRTSRAAAHMRYLLREGAVESLERELEMFDRVGAPKGRGRGLGREREPGGMQGYLEDPAKDEARRASPSDQDSFEFVFGNIGETLEERVEFWDCVEAHAKGDKSILQHRLIVELPHESTQADRVAIVEAFVAKYEQDRMRYCAVLHAPTPRNDDRNYHFHVVLLPYPAWTVKWPEAGKHYQRPDGPLVDTWTFAAKQTAYNSTRRSEEDPKPFKKITRIPEYYRQYFVVSERQRVADIVNARMAATGNPVRYDPRSYKAMGLDVEPMKSIPRIVADRARSGSIAVLDKHRLKREIEAELDRLARERAPDFAEIDAVRTAARAGEKALRRIERGAAFLKDRPIPKRRSESEPVHVRKCAVEWARRRAIHLEHKIDADQEAKALDRVIVATDPDEIARWRSDLARRVRKARASKRPDELERLHEERQAVPPKRVSDFLHAEATQRLSEQKPVHAAREKALIAKIGKAMAAWRRAAIGESRNFGPLVHFANVPMGGVSIATRSPPPRKTALSIRNQHPMWATLDVVAESFFKTEFQRYVWRESKKLGKFILDNADPDVPGREPLELAEKLANVLKQHNPHKTAAFIANFPPKPTGDDAMHQALTSNADSELINQRPPDIATPNMSTLHQTVAAAADKVERSSALPSGSATIGQGSGLSESTRSDESRQVVSGGQSDNRQDDVQDRQDSASFPPSGYNPDDEGEPEIETKKRKRKKAKGVRSRREGRER
jgi:hypothetical protein